MNLIFNKGTKWGAILFILHILLIILLSFFFQDISLPWFIDEVVDTLFKIDFALFSILCGGWNSGIFGRCGSNEVLAVSITATTLLLIHCVLGSMIYLAIKKIRKF